MTPTRHLDPAALHQAWQDALLARPMRTRDVAEFLEVSEAELMASAVGATPTRQVVRLKPPAGAILQEIPHLGRVMALTRNASVVHERKGVYENLSTSQSIGMALGDDIDLRLFLGQWQHAFAVTETGPDKHQRSVQFFDAYGDAVHKVFLQPESDADAFARVQADFADADQSPGLTVDTDIKSGVPAHNAAPDAKAFRTRWLSMTDTHEFFGLLKEFALPRTQALALAPPGMAYRVDPTAIVTLLQAASAQDVSIMVFVGNRGCIQIHTGYTKKIAIMGPWVNVLDADFNLHLRQDHVAECWLVRKPTSEGVVTSLEVFNAEGETLVQFFGKRKPGIPELANWRQLAEALPPLRRQHAA